MTPVPTCPYCGNTIESLEVPECPDCGVPHHAECWIANNGCSVRGCTQAPPDDPKLILPAPGVALRSPTRNGGTGLPGTVGPSIRASTLPPPRSRITYMVLGLLGGALGIHNFYAGYTVRGGVQLGLTCVTLYYGALISWPWAVLEVILVSRDARQQLMV